MHGERATCEQPTTMRRVALASTQGPFGVAAPSPSSNPRQTQFLPNLFVGRRSPVFPVAPFVFVLHGLSMVSMRHEVLVELFQNRPCLATELLAESLHVPQPAYDEARLASIALTEVQPAEYRADVVVVLYHNDEPIRVNIVEVQLGIDVDKRYSWPVYLAVSREKHRCNADLLVVAPDPVVAKWCAQRIEMGIPGFALEPPVLGRNCIPMVTDPEEASRRPELALLSAMAYGDSDQAIEIVDAALPAFANLDDKRSGFYLDILYDSVNEAARRLLEAKMKGYVYTSPFAVKHIQLGRDLGRDEGIKLGRDEGVKLGRDEGVKLGRDEGVKLGRDEGVKLGRDEGVKLALLTVLNARRIDVPEATRERILAETDITRLERWLEQAATASTLADVLAEPS